MKEISTIGLDIAKNVFQVHGVNKEGAVVEKKQVRRGQMFAYFAKIPPCLIGIEACATAHYWGRELSKMGHEVKLIPPSYVKPYVRRGKNDAVDAAAICEAVSRPHMRFVAIKTVEQQAALALHKTRDLLIRQRTQLANALRGHLAEFGFVFREGAVGVQQAIAFLSEPCATVPELARQALQIVGAQHDALAKAIADYDKKIREWHQANAESRRVATIPGIGIIGASAIAATIGDATQFKSGREFAAWLGLTPKQNSSGGKTTLGGISKQGNAYIRRLLVLGATGQLRKGRRNQTAGGSAWFDALVARKPKRVATVALANKMARVAWAVLVKQQDYQPRQAQEV
jgi:transposase